MLLANSRPIYLPTCLHSYVVKPSIVVAQVSSTLNKPNGFIIAYQSNFLFYVLLFNFAWAGGQTLCGSLA